MTYQGKNNTIEAANAALARNLAYRFMVFFRAFFFAFFGVKGLGGVFSIRRSTSSSEGGLFSFIVFPCNLFNVSIPCLL